MVGEFVIIRTRSAGVHMGILMEIAASGGTTTALLHNARRLHRWYGANTLSEVSQNGVAQNSRISKEVPRILLPEVIEVIPCSTKARTNLEDSRWS